VADPTRPGEIPDDLGLVTLAEQAMRHGGALFDHRFGLAHLTDAERAGHSLAELAYSAALAERALFGRWIVACEALNAGAGHDQVAAAMGLDADELHAGLRAWAHGQLRYGHITPARHAEVLALLPEQAEGGDPR
jgi:acyl transferase domain-containing protein